MEIYDAVRRPLAQRAVEVSRKNALLFSLNYPNLTSKILNECTADRKSQKLQELHDGVRANWEWCWTTKIDGDLDKAILALEDS